MSLDMNITVPGSAMDSADSESQVQSSAEPWLRAEDVVVAMGLTLAVTLASSIAVVMYLA